MVVVVDMGQEMKRKWRRGGVDGKVGGGGGKDGWWGVGGSGVKGA